MSDTIKLLVVDDEVDFLNTLGERLADRGFDVTEVTNGPDAVEAARTGGFDLALIDLKMPGMDGMELLKILRENHKYLEVLMLTGHGSIESAVECTRLGAIDYLLKPCSLEVLLEKLKDAYTTRLKKKFAADKERSIEIERLANQGDPLALWYEAREQMKHRPSLRSIFRQLRELDDSEK